MQNAPSAQHLTVDTPTGAVTICADQGAITGVRWGTGGQDSCALLKKAAAQIVAYFEDPEQGFDLPLHVNGSAFQRTVCDAMLAIPLGETREPMGISPKRLVLRRRRSGRPAEAIPFRSSFRVTAFWARRDLAGFPAGLASIPKLPCCAMNARQDC